MLGSAPHVLQVFQPNVGGVPAYVANLARGLRERGWRVSVAAPGEHSALGELEGVAERRLVIDCAPGLSPEADARALRTLIDVTRDGAVDLLHGHSSKASLLTALTARRTGRPSIYTPHTWAFQREGSLLASAPFAAVEAVLARRGHTRIVAVSDSEAAAAARWRIVRRDDVRVVRSGLPEPEPVLARPEARRRLGLEGRLPVVAWVARLHPAKRPEDLAPLAARLSGRARVVAVGQGLAGSAAGAALERAGGRVLRAVEPRLLLAAADVFVITSAWEALPFCVLEAMQASLPVVAYDVGDLRAQVVDGGSGFLVRPFDLDRLAWRVRLLADDPALRAALGAAGRRRLDAQFSYAAMVAAIETVYLEALGRAPARPALGLPLRRAAPPRAVEVAP